MDTIWVVIVILVAFLGVVVAPWLLNRYQNKKEQKNTFWEVFEPCINHKCVRYFSYMISYVKVRGKRIYKKTDDLVISSCLGCIQCDRFSKVDRWETEED